MPVSDSSVGSHQLLLRDPWGLDRSESRYVTQDFRAASLADAPQPHDHVFVASNGRRRKVKRSSTGNG
jgi:hypothetical protein